MLLENEISKVKYVGGQIGHLSAEDGVMWLAILALSRFEEQIIIESDRYKLLNFIKLGSRKRLSNVAHSKNVVSTSWKLLQLFQYFIILNLIVTN